MLKAVVFLGAIAALLPGCAPKGATQIELPVAGRLRLDGVTIVDTENGAPARGMSISIEGGRIVLITATTAMTADPAVESIDAAGKFVVPGYNNMHSHALAAENASGAMAMMLTEGVTGFRQMSVSPELLKARRDRTLPIGKDAPALLVMPGNLLLPFNTVSIEDTDVKIRQQKRDGADFIKIALVTPVVFLRQSRRRSESVCRLWGIYRRVSMCGKPPGAGFKSIEHLGPGDTLWAACSTQEAALLADDLLHPAMKAPPFKIPAFVQTFMASRSVVR